MKILKLTLKKKWFDMILSGEKKEEYRELKDYWQKRLEHPHYAPFVWNFKKYDAVEFTNGYGKDKPRMLVECIRIDIDDPRPEWYGENPKSCYVIYLGKILEKHNISFMDNMKRLKEQEPEIWHELKETLKKKLPIHDVIGRSEQLVCDHNLTPKQPSDDIDYCVCTKCGQYVKAN